jgi:hypothetical protein
MNFPVKFYRKRARGWSDKEREADSKHRINGDDMYMVIDHRCPQGPRFSVVAHLWEQRIGRRRDNSLVQKSYSLAWMFDPDEAPCYQHDPLGCNKVEGRYGDLL